MDTAPGAGVVRRAGGGEPGQQMRATAAGRAGDPAQPGSPRLLQPVEQRPPGRPTARPQRRYRRGLTRRRHRLGGRAVRRVVPEPQEHTLRVDLPGALDHVRGDLAGRVEALVDLVQPPAPGLGLLALLVAQRRVGSVADRRHRLRRRRVPFGRQLLQRRQAACHRPGFGHDMPVEHVARVREELLDGL